jgi:hypothetical protein
MLDSLSTALSMSKNFDARELTDSALLWNSWLWEMLHDGHFPKPRVPQERRVSELPSVKILAHRQSSGPHIVGQKNRASYLLQAMPYRQVHLPSYNAAGEDDDLGPERQNSCS